MGLLGVIWKVAALLVLAIIGLGAYLYFTDYEAKATVTERNQDGGGYFVTVDPDAWWIPYSHKAYIEQQYWDLVCEGYKVSYYVKSSHYIVYDEQGEQVYDSSSPTTTNVLRAAKCLGDNTTGTLGAIIPGAG